MGANQNFSRELDLYPKIDPTSLLTRSRPHSYREAIRPRNQIRNHGDTAEDNNRCKPRHVRENDAQKFIKMQLKSSQTFQRTPCERVQ
jgi:hypothetical protein